MKWKTPEPGKGSYSGRIYCTGCFKSRDVKVDNVEDILKMDGRGNCPHCNPNVLTPDTMPYFRVVHRLRGQKVPIVLRLSLS